MIHSDNPFAQSDDATRRLRGRLGSGVTVITSGKPETPTGLTVSSLVVVEGAPGRVIAVVGPNSDLYDTAIKSGRFIVHVCMREHAGLADVFAGLRPNPGGMFAGLSLDHTEWGPSIRSIPTRAYCSAATIAPVGWSGLLTGVIDRVDFDTDPDPLIHYRGKYRGLLGLE